MPAINVPLFGNLVLCALLVTAACTFSLALVVGRGRPRYLDAARYGAYATCALTAVGVFLLAYAFQAHDFRIRYVLRYSDRSMPGWYLWASLWGGQDGSVLWWTFLLSLYTALCVRSLKGRLQQLQPYIIATLMSVMIFFTVVMLFSANPFSTTVAGEAADGEGLNPLLQNYWMIIHPPTLYLGMVGWAVPFAFAIAALVTGRLDDEWTVASRRWVLFAWIALATGNALGMLWSYEELGWGGYWAWDPVENAAFMPLLPATAFLHSVMLQQRRGMFKVWNVFLICLTFFMTIFGTFLTRSGMIASVHSFARSSIGSYFVVYMVILAVACGALIIWRLPLLRAEATIDSLLSRDFVFLLNNWILIGMLLFVLGATTAPLISEGLFDETITVAAAYYNKWMVPLGLVLMALVGVGPLLAWRKSTGAYMGRVLRLPLIAMVVVGVLHAVFGSALGYPPMVASDEIYNNLTGRLLASVYGALPIVASTICTFVLVGHIQEFWRGTSVRMRNAKEGVFTALFELITRAKRRYGGYLVHMGLMVMYFGFTGAAYDQEKESALKPGQSLSVGDYQVRYDRSRMELDPSKRMLFTDMTVLRDGEIVGYIAPAKFIYNKPPDTATTEVAIRSTAREDLYAIMNTVNPETKTGTFRVIVRPFVAWIWIGALMMIFGTAVSMAPSVREVLGESHQPVRARVGLATATLLLFVIALVAAFAMSTFAMPATAHGQSDGSSSLHAGSVSLRNPAERQLFEGLLCECGDCQRLPLSTCSCGWAEDMRDELREKLDRGVAAAQITEDYRARFGAASIAIPPDRGFGRALWAVPMLAIMLAGAGLVRIGRKWRKRTNATEVTDASGAQSTANTAALDAALDAELDRLKD
jgi:cytochrome c-type biogenesis protein CcmF